MSIKVMSWVWENSPARGSQLLLLLAIADHSDDDGIAFPSVLKLAKKTRMSRASVFRAMAPLVDSGQLKIEAHGGGRDTNEYQIVMATGLKMTPHPSQDETGTGLKMTPQQSQSETGAVADCDGSGLNVETAPVSLLRHRTVNQPSEVTTTSCAPADADTRQRDAKTERKPNPLARFDDFWRVYPKKKGKPAAQKAFAKAVTAGADPQAIIDGAIAYSLECRMKDPQYIKYAQGWLNDGRWQDEPDRAFAPPVITGPSAAAAAAPPPISEVLARQAAYDGSDDPWTRAANDPFYEPPF